MSNDNESNLNNSHNNFDDKDNNDIKKTEINTDISHNKSGKNFEHNHTNYNMGRINPNDINKSDFYVNYKNKKANRIKSLMFVLCILCLSFILAYFTLTLSSDVMGIGKIYKEIYISIPQGSNTEQIANILKENNVINYPTIFRVFSKLFGKDGTYQYGEYKLSSNMPYSDIIQNLQKVSHKKNSVRITFKEGLTLNDFAKLLEENKITLVPDFLQAINNPDPKFELLREIKNSDIKYQKMEGFAFPNTYEFFLNEDPKSVANKFFSEFERKFDNRLRNRMKEMNMSLQDTITLASIIQGEAGKIEEMKKVSSVFHNRLNNSSEYPKLQSDPTKNYVRDDISPNVSSANTEIFRAYDTYQGEGLPPGAINNPGLEAIEAALYPDSTPYYYFASNLNTGQFYYAKTLGEHEQNLIKAGLK